MEKTRNMVSKLDAKEQAGNAAYVAGFLKNHDLDRYYSTLFLNEKVRAGVQSLYAFSTEISRIRSLISEPATGEIRLQYWVDLISGISHGNSSQNPIASALLGTIRRHDLPAAPLLRLLAARRFDLYDDPMPDIQSLEGYLGETNSMLYQLACMMVNGGDGAGSVRASGHMGVAHGLIGHMLGIGQTLGRGQIYLPLSMLEAHGVEQDMLFAGLQETGNTGTGIPELFASLRELARDHLGQARAAIGELHPGMRPVFSLYPVLEWRLKRLEGAAGSPLAPPSDMAPWKRIGRMLWWSVRN